MMTRYFVPRCLLKHRSVKLMKLLENRFTSYSSKDLRLWHPESSSTVMLLLHADWMMLKNASNQGGANSVTVLSTWKLVASKATFLENYLAVSTWIFNGSSIECHKFSVCLVFDLEAGWFKFLGENLLGAGELECACHGTVFIISFCFCRPAIQSQAFEKKSIGSPVRKKRTSI